MKLNFWQWVGILLLVLGAGLYVYENSGATNDPVPSNTRPAHP